MSEPPIRTLVAEDNDDLRLVLAMRLRMMGMDVTHATNGESAVEQARAASRAGRPFDLILMDLEMPVVDGYEATRRLRRHGHLEPILAMTAHAQGDDVDCQRIGCDGHITKPIDWDRLDATIRESVVRSRSRDAAGESQG
jgi:CheY-like chemotaxis protein